MGEDRTVRDAENLLAWAKREGSLARIKLTSGQFGWEARAAEEIKPGSPIIDIPRRLCLTGALALETFPVEIAIKNTHQKEERLEDVFQAALSLLVERSRGETSFWSAYIKMLPREPLDIHLNTMKPSDVRMALQDTSMLPFISGGLEKMQNVVRKLVEVAPSCKNESYVPGFTISQNDALWAVSMVKSRGFSNAAGLGGKTCLLPIGDMLNYGGRSSPELSNIPKGGGLGFLSTSTIAKGAPATDSYGHHHMDGTYLSYGFALPDSEVLEGAQLNDKWAQLPKEMGERSEPIFNLFVTSDCTNVMARNQQVRSSALEEYLLPCARMLSVTP
jgi:hypothetical protein